MTGLIENFVGQALDCQQEDQLVGGNQYNQHHWYNFPVSWEDSLSKSFLLSHTNSSYKFQCGYTGSKSSSIKQLHEPAMQFFF